MAGRKDGAGEQGLGLTPAELGFRAPGCRLERTRLEIVPLGRPRTASRRGLGMVSRGGTASQGSRAGS